MKKALLTALLTLTLLLTLSTAALAYQVAVYDVDTEGGYDLICCDEAGTQLGTTSVIIGSATEDVYEDPFSFKLSFNGATTTQYLVLMLSDVSGNETPYPTASNIRYIDQKAGDGGSEPSTNFTMLPDSLTKASGKYAICVADSNGNYDPVVTFMVNVAYMLGDVNFSGYVDAIDALMTLEFYVGKAIPTPLQKLAANMWPDDYIDSRDALAILRAYVSAGS